MPNSTKRHDVIIWPFVLAIGLASVTLDYAINRRGVFPSDSLTIVPFSVAALSLCVAGILRQSRSALLLGTATASFAFAFRSFSLVFSDLDHGGRFAGIVIFGLLAYLTAALAAYALADLRHRAP